MRKGGCSMGKKVLALAGSPRKDGNSDLLCRAFLEAAARQGNDTEMIRLADKRIAPCRACYACRRGGCAQKDDMAEILEKMVQADVILLASPLYFYSISAQMKAMMDRTLARWTEISDKKFFYIITAAQNNEKAADTALECFRKYSGCFRGTEEGGHVFAAGVHRPGEVMQTEYLKTAENLGESV